MDPYASHPTVNLPTALIETLNSDPALEFSVLVGSRANGTATSRRSWDIAVEWNPQTPWLPSIPRSETLCRQVADALQECESLGDLIDLNLTMRPIVAEEGFPLTDENTSAWARFLPRTWRELEEHYLGIV